MRACEIMRAEPGPVAAERYGRGFVQPVPLHRLQFIIEAVCTPPQGGCAARNNARTRRRCQRRQRHDTATQAPPPIRTHKDGRNWVGKSIRRLEDPKFLRGRGSYIGDMTRRDAARRRLSSPYAHARIISIDADRGSSAPGCGRGDHRRRSGRAGRPTARTSGRTRPPRVAPAGRRQGPLRGRGRRGDCRHQPLHRRGRESTSSRSSTSRCRCCVTRRGAEGRGAARARGARIQLGYERSSSSATSTRTSRRPTWSSPTACTGTVPARSRWRRSAPSPSYDHGTGMMEIHANSLSFTSYLFMMAMTLKIPENRLDITPHPAGGSFGSKLWAVKVSATAGMCPRRSGGRSSTSRTGSTTSPTATTTALTGSTTAIWR